jgi:hypothetical protein
MNTVNGYIAIAESGAIRQQSVAASLTETPGLVVTRAYLATKAQRDKATRWKEVVLQTFHAEKCQVIHRDSGALIATFPDRQHAMDAAESLGTLGIDWTQARMVIATRFPSDSYQRLQVQHIIQRHKGVPPARLTS